MKKSVAGIVVLLLTAGAVLLYGQQPLPLPQPTKGHEWLLQLVGEWDSDTEIVMQPGQPPVTARGTESVRSIGGFWTVCEVRSTILDQPITGIMTLGYNPEKKKYIGTWVDSVSHHLWQYEGSLDEAGRVLTLEAEGPALLGPGATARYRDSFEIKSEDHKVFTSSIEVEPGKWHTFMTVNYHRKK